MLWGVTLPDSKEPGFTWWYPPQSGEPIRRPLAWHSAQASRPDPTLDRAIADGQTVGDRR